MNHTNLYKAMIRQLRGIDLPAYMDDLFLRAVPLIQQNDQPVAPDIIAKMIVYTGFCLLAEQYKPQEDETRQLSLDLLPCLENNNTLTWPEPAGDSTIDTAKRAAVCDYNNFQKMANGSLIN
jgi:hypothetical protein